ncbi:Prephenate dehydratase-domain-containing protein [Phaeosphaeria sp. MPI-PUGE-AT-0046c]|nr:Prephenate dehydratase-domain-containing protein [Phaeosphaeria sp. MPI-PUGE-AT-0046c]
MAEDERPVVAFLGPEASYTHQAALSAFPPKSTILSPQITIADVFTSVQNGTATRGVVPLENSSNGSVVFTLDLIGDLHGTHPDILVCGEVYVAVKHCLLGHLIPGSTPSAPRTDVVIDSKFSNPLATPAGDLSKIKRLYSHPQAWGQCKAFLATYMKGVERHDVSSTSKAAEIAAQDASGESAALSSKVAASVFGCDVLAESINDHLGNTTRFLVIKRRESPPLGISRAPTPTPASVQTMTESAAANEVEGSSSIAAPLSSSASTQWKSLVTFTINHTSPGALASCLAVFSKHGLNLTSINTRPSGTRNWHYIFFVEFKGRKEDGDEVGEVNGALRELDGACEDWRWKGSWEGGN